MAPSSPDHSDLSDLRRRIDALDDDILSLVIDRSRIVEDVIRAKTLGPGGAMRPAREAQILRRLADQHNGPLPFATIARIWRELISALTVMQQADFSIALTSDSALPAARNHFGGGVPMTAMQSAQAVLRAVGSGEATLGLLPLPDGSTEGRWWQWLTGSGFGDAPPQVILRLPFVDAVSTQDGGDWLAVARTPQEPSDKDHSLLALAMPAALSRSSLMDRLGKAGLDVVELLDMTPEADAALVVLDGFVSQDDPRLQDMAPSGSDWLDHARIIGIWACPIRA
ncbi:MAG: chorismate mutase [Alphaproteobacteria bacterium]